LQAAPASRKAPAMRWLALLLLAAAPAPAHDPSRASPEALRNNSGLPVPRFQSLRAEKAHLRAGPGKEYPARATYVRAGLPVEVIAEWNVWRQVRDAEGEVGWIDRALLQTDRHFLITGTTRTLVARPDVSAPPVLRAEPGVVFRIVTCAELWCRLEADGRSGWLLREQGFGTYPGEAVGN